LLVKRQPRREVTNGDRLTKDSVEEGVLRVLEDLVAHRSGGTEAGRRDRNDVHEEDVGGGDGATVGGSGGGGRGGEDAGNAGGGCFGERTVGRVDEGDEVLLVGEEAAEVGANFVGRDDALGLLAANGTDRLVVFLFLLDYLIFSSVDFHRIVLLFLLILRVRRVSIDVHPVPVRRLAVRRGGSSGGSRGAVLVAEDVRALDAENAVDALLLGDEGVLDDLGVTFLAEAVGETVEGEASIPLTLRGREKERQGTYAPQCSHRLFPLKLLMN
jgi:hypothetical protein